jgi:dihydroneopterin aldolase
VNNTDRLSIVGLEVWARVGCTAEERGFPQRLEVDADLYLPLARAGQQDDLSLSVDYAAVVRRLSEVLAGGEFRLVESLTEKAADVILGEFPVSRTVVRVRKRALPGIAFMEIAVERRGRPRRHKM